MPAELEPLEAAVLDKLLAGTHPVLAALRAQLAGATVKHRTHTGVGFFTDFAPAQDAIPAPVRTLRFGDVRATIEGLQHGADFVLFVEDGLLVTLEGFSCDEPWPAEIVVVAVGYWDPARPDLETKLR